MELEEYLSKKLGVKVDLVTSDALKPMIKSQIMREVVYV
jgi:predicted nucleotidyltransferase